jgi:hypothetical protein
MSGQALPAVMVPSGRKAGSSWDTASHVMPGRGPPSALTAVPPNGQGGLPQHRPAAPSFSGYAWTDLM